MSLNIHKAPGIRLSPDVNMTKYVGEIIKMITTQRQDGLCEPTTGLRDILGRFQVKIVYFGISSKYHCI